MRLLQHAATASDDSLLVSTSMNLHIAPKDKQDLQDFKRLLSDDNDDIITLNKEKVLELVKWVMRQSHDSHRNKEIVSMFSSCLDGELTFDEFCLMYEEISTRVELEHVFDKKFRDLDVENNGFITKSESIQIVDHILLSFAQIWCNKREIVEMKRNLVRLLEAPISDCVWKQELFEVFDGMLVTIRLIHLTKQKMNEFDQDHNGHLDSNELTALADWILKSYDRNAIKVSMEEKIALKERILSSYDEDHNGIINIRELAFLFESIMEVSK
jgi:Ca2+-binding EF-hand superfamily protein